MRVWKKQVSAVDTDGWVDRISSAVDPLRVVIFHGAGKSRPQLRVYSDSADEVERLAARFGGQSCEVCPESWQPPPVTLPGRPLVIGKQLLITSRPEEVPRLRSIYRDRIVLCIPAAMAFGTGEHATTSMCLRLLLEASRRQPQNWRMLDLGTGSGILALAAAGLGADHVTGIDDDPHAVRTARDNLRLNQLPPRSASFVRADLRSWKRTTKTAWPVVTANLFSELLIELLPEIIAPSVEPGGDLVLSGVLAVQTDEVTAAVRAAGLRLLEIKRRGRWRAFHCRCD